MARYLVHGDRYMNPHGVWWLDSLGNIRSYYPEGDPFEAAGRRRVLRDGDAREAPDWYEYWDYLSEQSIQWGSWDTFESEKKPIPFLMDLMVMAQGGSNAV